MKLEGEITLLVNQNNTTIRIQDAVSSVTVCEVTLTPEQLSSALSRLANTPCQLDVDPDTADRWGKPMEVEYFEFEIPDGLSKYAPDHIELGKYALSILPEGWTATPRFNSQNSFFTKDGKRFARCIMRRWVSGEAK